MMIRSIDSVANVGGQFSPLAERIKQTLTFERARVEVRPTYTGQIDVKALGFDAVRYGESVIRKLMFADSLVADDGPDSSLMALETTLSLPSGKDVLIYRAGLMLIPWYINLYRPDISNVFVVEPVMELFQIATTIWPMNTPAIKIYHANMLQYFGSKQYTQEGASIGSIVWNNNTELEEESVLKSYFQMFSIWRKHFPEKRMIFVGLKSPFSGTVWPAFAPDDPPDRPEDQIDLDDLFLKPDTTTADGVLPDNERYAKAVVRHNLKDDTLYDEDQSDDDDDDGGGDDDDDDDQSSEDDEDGETVDADATPPGIVKIVTRATVLEDWERELLED